MKNHIYNSLHEAAFVLKNLYSNEVAIEEIEKAAILMIDCLTKKSRIFSCGNGGSMCDSQHFAEELSGRYRNDRLPLAAISITDPSHISCTANDYGYEYVFSRYLEAHGREGDVLLAITTSGSSKNVIKAAERAKELGLSVVALTGKLGSDIAKFSDIHIATPSFSYADRVQELHIKVIHILIELIERSLFPENYK